MISASPGVAAEKCGHGRVAKEVGRGLTEIVFSRNALVSCQDKIDIQKLVKWRLFYWFPAPKIIATVTADHYRRRGGRATAHTHVAGGGGVGSLAGEKKHDSLFVKLR